MKKQLFVIALFTVVFFSTIKAQHYNHYLNSFYNYELNKVLDSKSNFHSSIKPYIINDINNYVNYDSIQKLKTKTFFNQKHLKFKNKLFNQHFIDIKEKDFTLIADPLINFSLGHDFNHSINTYVNTRGFQIMGNIGNKLSFYTAFYENQARFPEYIKNTIEKTGVIPGQGIRKEFGNGGYDYSRASGYISYSPSKIFNIQFGTGKNFIGDGHRSLLLSDNSFNYPYLKITTTVWKIKYINLFTEFQDIQTLGVQGERFDKKYAAIHYLSWNATKRLTLGIFEAIIFPAKDSTGNRGFEINYLNPIIFYRPVESSIGSPDNTVLGLNGSYQLSKNTKIYGQFMLDEFRIKDLTNGSGYWANKFGYQLGIKCFEFLKVKNLYLQCEYNRIRPYTYSHKKRILAYGHYNQPLAHPFGANFWEFLTIAHYHKSRFYFNYQFIYSKFGENIGDDNYGKNIFQSYETRVQDLNNKVAQGLTTSLLYNNLECSYLINPSYNLNFVIGFTSRITKNDIKTDKTNFFYIGLRTSIDNFYYDF